MTQQKILKTVRIYRKDTFRAHQDEKVNKLEKAIDDALVLLGKSELKFRNTTLLAKHVSAMLNKEGKTCHFSTILRRHHTKDSAETPNPYRLLLQRYEMGKYFGKGKNPAITVEDIKDIRRKFPAVDAYCALKEGESKNLQEQVKLLNNELYSLQKSGTLPQQSNTTGISLDEIDRTVMALKRLLDAASEFFQIDWEKRAIVDISHRNPMIVVEPALLSAFFSALEKSGMKPPEVT